MSSLARLRPVEDKTVEKSCPPSFCAVWIGQSTANVPFLAPRVVRGFSGRKGGTAGSTGKTGPVAEKEKSNSSQFVGPWTHGFNMILAQVTVYPFVGFLVLLYLEPVDFLFSITFHPAILCDALHQLKMCQQRSRIAERCKSTCPTHISTYIVLLLRLTLCNGSDCIAVLHDCWILAKCSSRRGGFLRFLSILPANNPGKQMRTAHQGCQPKFTRHHWKDLSQRQSV